MLLALQTCLSHVQLSWRQALQHAALKISHQMYEQITNAMHRPRTLVLLLCYALQAIVYLVPLPTI